MKYAAILQTSIELLDQIWEQNQPADHLSRQFFKSRRFIGAKDRKLIAEIVFFCIRFKSTLHWWAEQFVIVDAQSLILVMLVLDQRASLSEVQELFCGQQYGPDELSDREANLVNFLQDKQLYDPLMPLHVRWNVPLWCLERLQSVLDENFVKEMAMLGENAPLDVRVNTLRSTNEQAETFFQSQQIPYERLSLTPNAYRLPRGVPLSQSDFFQQGCIEVQDLGSQVIIEECNVRPGMRVLDFCAGAGGKTLGLAAKMGGKGALIACDTSDVRLKQCQLRLKRAGAFNAETRMLDSQNLQWLKRQRGRFDVVIVDVPCTGSGTWRRNPDLKWRMNEESLASLVALQRTIILQVAPLVKPGGFLVYSTCSFFVEENEDQVAGFVQECGDFVLTKQQRLSPATSDTDGFYCAVLAKTKH